MVLGVSIMKEIKTEIINTLENITDETLLARILTIVKTAEKIERADAMSTLSSSQTSHKNS